MNQTNQNKLDSWHTNEPKTRLACLSLDCYHIKDAFTNWSTKENEGKYRKNKVVWQGLRNDTSMDRGSTYLDVYIVGLNKDGTGPIKELIIYANIDWEDLMFRNGQQW